MYKTTEIVLNANNSKEVLIKELNNIKRQIDIENIYTVSNTSVQVKINKKTISGYYVNEEKYTGQYQLINIIHTM
jgi:hypothetical protein